VATPLAAADNNLAGAKFSLKSELSFIILVFITLSTMIIENTYL